MKQESLEDRTFELVRFNIGWEGGSDVTLKSIQEQAIASGFTRDEVLSSEFESEVENAYTHMCNDWPYGLEEEYGRCPDLITNVRL
jgi:hypothetical protein